MTACGEEFSIFHDPALANQENATQQANWWKGFWLQSTSKNGHTRIESSCPNGLHVIYCFDI